MRSLPTPLKNTFEEVFNKVTKIHVFAYFASAMQACETKRILLKRGRFARYTDHTGDSRDPKRLSARNPKNLKGTRDDVMKGENCNTAVWRRFCDASLNLALKKEAIYFVKMQIQKKRSKHATISYGFFNFTC